MSEASLLVMQMEPSVYICIYSPLLGGCYDYDNAINLLYIALPRCAEWLYLPIAFSYSALYNSML